VNNKQFKDLVKNIGINLTDDMIDKFDTYYNFLVEYNKKINLTRITNKEDVYVKHFIDSIMFADVFKKNASMCDIGAGAGFPGIPLKIVRPDLNITLIDSVNKKVIFLGEVIERLSLTKIAVVHTRAEDFVIKNRGRFDYAVARAVASLNTLSEYSLPFIKKGGQFVALKASGAHEELIVAKNAIKILGGRVNRIMEKSLLSTDIIRKAIIIDKVTRTPAKYPRGGNKPRLKPL
jgi:16S rRNA (guanine527-N7)-methyltransferase